MSKDWTDKLPSLLEEYEESAPEGLWDAVLDGMARRKKRAAAFWWGGALLSAAAAVVLAVFLWKPATEPASVSSVPETMLAETLPENAPDDATAGEIGEAADPRMAPPERPAKRPAAPKPSAEEPLPQTQEPAVTEVLPTENRPHETAPEKTPVPTETLPEKSPVPAETLPQKPAKEDTFPESFGTTDREKPAAKEKIQLRLSSGTYLAQAANELFKGYGVPYNPGMTIATKSGEEGEITVPMLSRNRESSTEARHRQLLRVQLGVTYPLSKRWSIGSGVSYSLLQSEYATVSGETRTQTTRQLHYLGVPLTAQFKAFEFKRLSILAEAGPMFEAAVGSKVWTQSYVGDMLASRQLEYPLVKDFRWSLNAGLSVQCQLFRHGAIFVQPGISWHFAGNGNVESVYSLQPLSFDFSFGFRFTL